MYKIIDTSYMYRYRYIYTYVHGRSKSSNISLGMCCRVYAIGAFKELPRMFKSRGALILTRDRLIHALIQTRCFWIYTCCSAPKPRAENAGACFPRLYPTWSTYSSASLLWPIPLESLIFQASFSGAEIQLWKWCGKQLFISLVLGV